MLALFLEQQQRGSAGVGARHVLEVGAGCGLLGMVLAAAGCDVVLSEHPIALANLQSNVSACKPVSQRARVVQLDWTKQSHVQALVAAQRARDCPTCFDTIVGTDVVFSEHLVVPLLDTIHTLAGAKTTVWLCLQERCAAAHKLLLASIPGYFGHCAQIQSPAATVVKGCDEDVGAVIEALHGQLECVMLKLTGRLERTKDTSGAEAKCCEQVVSAPRQDDPPLSTPTAATTQCQPNAPVVERGKKRRKRDRQRDQIQVHGDREARKKRKKSKKNKG